MKVKITDTKLITNFYKILSIVATLLSVYLIFYTIKDEHKSNFFIGFIVASAIVYIALWYRYNKLNKIELNIDNSTVIIKEGDIFQQDGLKVIAFNEYFDTITDNVIISKNSLNGVFIDRYFSNCSENLNEYISSYPFKNECIVGTNDTRPRGNKIKYKLGTICLYDDEFILTAFTHFDDDNRAYLTMSDYLSFLVNFWDQVNIVYALRSVSTPVFGSGITRIKGHTYISDEDLLKIMIWTFKISEMKFKHPANLTIVVSPDKFKKINLLEIKGTKNGI
uniref:macro domain-containing protein n=1 Tax=Hafnia alvei TaxID=569 RepID=UPI00266B5E24|nr:macro domain-containing protein [Hafnia alvei]